MFKVEFTPYAEKQLLKLDSDIQDRIINVLDRIVLRPYHFVKKKEGTPYFIMRAGEHRAIIDINNQTKIIYVIEVGPRKNIYD